MIDPENIVKMYMTDLSFCEQRTLNQLLNRPLARFEPINPYGSIYTKYDFDMRRKAEILKYSSNRSSTQTNNVTKKQQFSQIVKGNVEKLPQYQQFSAGLACSNTGIYRPTSSSGVPGPVMYLYEDPAVTLYNYNPIGSRAYTLNVPENTSMWLTTIRPDIQFSNNTISTLFYLQITKFINRRSYMFDLVLPVGIQVNGIVMDASSRTIQIDSVSLNIYYDTRLVNTYTNGNTMLGTGLFMNFSGSTIGSSFTANQFLGNIGFNGIELYTESGYAYTIKATFHISVSYTNSNETSTIDPAQALSSYYAIGNIVAPNTNINCSVLSSGSSIDNSGFQFGETT